MQEIQYQDANGHVYESLKAKVLSARDTDVFSRDEVACLLEAHEMLIHRMDRIVKISDSYQYELKDTSRALQEALAKVKMLSGLIPICSACKKVRSVDGYWKQIEQYITEYSEANISHGLCPECAANYMHMLGAKDKAPAAVSKSPIELSDEDLDHPVVAQYLTVVNNRHFAGSPLYDDLVRLLQKYIRLERRMQRIVRISDMYQSELQEIREKFEQEAKLDYLTGLTNRREMYRLLDTEISRIDRYGGTFALIMFDYDQFKIVNDNYGHEAGDAILQKGAKLVQRKLRKQDICARWGGEEFMIFQPESTPEGVLQCSERLRKAIAKESMYFGSIEIKVSVSMGVALYRKGEKPEECINRADKSLYAAKKSGRNQTGPLE